jgi:molybdopterin converting factor subunit 1
MRVEVRLFARLRDIVGSGTLTRQEDPGTTVRSVWRRLVADYPALEPYERSISAAINAEYARMDATVGDGDEVAFLPPVSGG